MNTAPASPAPHRRGRPRKTIVNPQFPGTVIRFDSRPRLMVGDVVELCRGCRPCNHGKIGVITHFYEDGVANVRALPGRFFNTFDGSTGASTGTSDDVIVAPENLYRRSRSSLRGAA